MMLGYLLARAGVKVTILEKHRDFFRDFAVTRSIHRFSNSYTSWVYCGNSC